MKNIIIAIMFSFFALFANAEPSFNQVQTLIASQEYRAAEKGLEEIIANHPKSAKAFYAMAQAQAGLGNLTKAQHALDKAMGLNPTLDFAPQAAVENLKQAIHPQVAKIEVIEESHFGRNLAILLILALAGYVGYVLYDNHQKRVKRQKVLEQEAITKYQEAQKRRFEAQATKPTTIKVDTPAKPAITASVAPIKRSTPVATTQSAPVPEVPVAAHTAPTTTVVHNSSNDLLTGVLIGNMLGSNNHNHSSTREVVRETVREVPAPSSTWDTPDVKPAKSSWDDAPSTTTRSNSWEDSSPSSSSWSSSSSDSSSSWSDSSSSSSSSWD